MSLRLLLLGMVMISLMLLPFQPARPAPTALYSVDFEGFPGGTVLKWLTSKGFQPKQDSTNASKVVYFDQGNDLVLETKKRAFGLLLNEADVRGYSKIRI